MGDAEGRGSFRVSSGTDTSAVSATPNDMFGCGGQSSAGRDVELELEGMAVATRATASQARKHTTSHAVNERTVEKCFGDIGRPTAVEEVKEACVPISTQLGSKALGVPCDMAVKRVPRWRLEQCV
ncbi:molybdenum cofactor biosynthesis protein [Babesia caballi]|uniref:Molybdenum cofactor biosynthesis protein n=1 Tax=Babesia caballi TaxID=5871 RepID=A0AAV4M3S6_BABCB|nr:molybdenum cofactor biosynthesis protein [Babesia caballi]